MRIIILVNTCFKELLLILTVFSKVVLILFSRWIILWECINGSLNITMFILVGIIVIVWLCLNLELLPSLFVIIHDYRRRNHIRIIPNIISSRILIKPCFSQTHFLHLDLSFLSLLDFFLHILIELWEFIVIWRKLRSSLFHCIK